MGRVAALMAVLAVMACGLSQTPRSATSPGPSPNSNTSPGLAPKYAVLVTGQDTYSPTSDAPTYTLSIVTTNGQVVASATAANPNHVPLPWQPLPIVSASASRVYYLDGNSSVKYLKPDGAGGLASQLPNQADERAVFAVSSDDTKIAVSVFNLKSGMRLLVASLGNSPAWHQIFASTVMSEWPLGWRGNEIVLGLGYPVGGQQLCAECSWRPGGVHLVNAETGSLSVTVCEPDPNNSRSAQFPSAPPTPVGVLCETASNPTPNGLYTTFAEAIAHWDGSDGPTIPVPAISSCTLRGSLSPDGQMIASIRDLADCSNGNAVNLFDTSGHARATSAVTSDPWLLWIDPVHLCYATGSGQSSILDVAADQVVAISGPGLCMASIPGGLSA
jgi:hypothetical protein